MQRTQKEDDNEVIVLKSIESRTSSSQHKSYPEILVVDDDTMNLFAMTSMFEIWNVKADTVATYNTAK